MSAEEAEEDPGPRHFSSERSLFFPGALRSTAALQPKCVHRLIRRWSQGPWNKRISILKTENRHDLTLSLFCILACLHILGWMYRCILAAFSLGNFSTNKVKDRQKGNPIVIPSRMSIIIKSRLTADSASPRNRK